MPLPLSVCLIVRDEEHNLGGALASVSAVANELVVVDTGSTDRSVAVAREHGAQVLQFAWVDDFSAARNFCIQHATQPSILTLDADERLDPDTLTALEAFCAENTGTRPSGPRFAFAAMPGVISCLSIAVEPQTGH